MKYEKRINNLLIHLDVSYLKFSQVEGATKS